MRRHHLLHCLFATLVLAIGTLRAQEPTRPAVKDASLGGTTNVHSCGTLFLAGQPTQEDIGTIKDRGIQRVISLRGNDEVDWDEAAAIKDAGLDFVSIPFRSPDSLTDDVFGQVRRLLRGADKTPTLLHCGSANRVGAVWLTYRVLDQGVPFETAMVEAKTIGLRSAAFEAKARDYVQRHAAEQRQADVPQGINENFLKADLDIKEWLGRFEIESREVFAARQAILEATGVRPGSRVADVGAGTGLFTRLFSEAAGDQGWVFAVDISPSFIAHINRRAQDDRLANVTAVLCPENSITLPPESIDVAFVCDAYHHLEYPQASLRSIHRALRTGGTLIVIDFERIPGKSREFVLTHVRAGKDTFRSEIERAGFVFVDEVELDGLEENYLLRLKKP